MRADRGHSSYLGHHTFKLIGCLIYLVLGFPSIHAQDEDDPEYEAGLIATYRDEQVKFQRIDPTIAFVWNENSPDPRLAGEPFSAVWEGYLLTKGKGTFHLHAYVSGRIRVSIEEQVLIDQDATSAQWIGAEPIEFVYGYHPIKVEFSQSTAEPRIQLFWSGPQFQLEPIDRRSLFHDPHRATSDPMVHGAQLVRALRCDSCHQIPGHQAAIPAPALDRLAGNLDPLWLERWLTSKNEVEVKGGEPSVARRMPHFDLSSQDVQAIAAYLYSSSLESVPPTQKTDLSTDALQAATPKKKSKDAKATKPLTEAEQIAAGQRHVLALGCLACHQVGTLGARSLFDGGDLSEIASKRPAEFFERWLVDPAKINKHHRMPVYDLSSDELAAIATYLKSCSKPLAEGDRPAQPKTERLAKYASHEIEAGKRLVRQNGCAACHAVPEIGWQQKPAALSAISDWSNSCANRSLKWVPKNRQPYYSLSSDDAQAIQTYIASLPKQPTKLIARGESLLTERNCVACHARDQWPGLAPKLTAVAADFPDLAAQLPAMTPPSLAGVGDKLHDDALNAAIARSAGVHRPYLQVRMPKYQLPPEEMQAILTSFVATDRIPENSPQSTAFYEMDEAKKVDHAAMLLAGERLVTPDGFGCTSCHQVGSVQPPPGPINARGPDLSLLGKRIRRPWFDRWVRNPARMIPGMEMPSVQIPVQGVLADSLDRQLAAVWHTLNRPGFEPPLPNPVRVVRRSGILERQERAVVLTDVLRIGKKTLVKPFIVGLPNRHNVLLDLETNRLAGWWIGDTARQRTEGKTWFWEIGGTNLLDAGNNPSDVQIESKNQWIAPSLHGQFVTEFEAFEHIAQGIVLTHRLFFSFEDASEPRVVTVKQKFHATESGKGVRRELLLEGLPPGRKVRWNLAGTESLSAESLNTESSGSKSLDHANRTVSLPGLPPKRLTIQDSPAAEFVRLENSVAIVFDADASQRAQVAIDYISELPADTYPFVAPEVAPPPAVDLQVVPGYEATQLPLAQEMMPTGLAWREDGSLVISSLKGRVWIARDTDHDSLEDSLAVFSDDLAAPYGVATGPGYIDVINKYALLRLHDRDRDGHAERTETLLSGWGHTQDYHDWAVGLPRDEQGNYYVAIPCQQDDRSVAAANLRGKVLRLRPRKPTAENRAEFAIEAISSGHRFPMGIARDRSGELFVTDNQGNYNPFNELNHVLPGKHFGFINKLERSQADALPELTAPAIDIPHPWTRSVNGICFLETPEALRGQAANNHFGPFEGHLVGCEFDTRRLIRMSLQRVGETVQGAAYPFTYAEPAKGPALQGPVVCAVAPDGDLYIGSLRDSGWGGANNLGTLARLRPQSGQLPAGIAEVQHRPGGFLILFTAPVKRHLAEDMANYSIESYTRLATPAYGGPDVERRHEKIRKLRVSPDCLQVELDLDELREGFVYEFNLRSLVEAAATFFPAEAYYTLRVKMSAE